MAVALGLLALVAGAVVSPTVDVHAHRGGAGLAPENTLAAFRNALALGADYLEMDLHASADGEVVVIHDATLQRTTNGRGYVRQTPLAELQRLDAGSWFHGRFAGERIPTLREVLEMVRVWGDSRIRLNLETKYDANAPPPADFEERILGLVREAGMADRILLQSFFYPSLVRVRALNAAVPTAVLRRVSDIPSDAVAVVREARASVYSPNFRLIGPDVIEALHRAGVPVVPWTVNEPADMERMLEAGIGRLPGDGIITDYPDRLLQLLRARGLRR
ncbi:MAG: glycerophosphodiester phosphodiesterase family protein [Armatimonadota bacterium]|nr:glycerophosphodiester phosphodiesterase family protein [Armatimonadota bacterium]MDR7549789.1 glycerophosphodiester phosphodiesterase family protein [Armatimonadota bacterium]